MATDLRGRLERVDGRRITGNHKLRAVHACRGRGGVSHPAVPAAGWYVERKLIRIAGPLVIIISDGDIDEHHAFSGKRIHCHERLRRACISSCPSQSIKEKLEDFDHMGCFRMMKVLVKKAGISGLELLARTVKVALVVGAAWGSGRTRTLTSLGWLTIVATMRASSGIALPSRPFG